MPGTPEGGPNMDGVCANEDSDNESVQSFSSNASTATNVTKRSVPKIKARLGLHIEGCGECRKSLKFLETHTEEEAKHLLETIISHIMRFHPMPKPKTKPTKQSNKRPMIESPEDHKAKKVTESKDFAKPPPQTSSPKPDSAPLALIKATGFGRLFQIETKNRYQVLETKDPEPEPEPTPQDNSQEEIRTKVADTIQTKPPSPKATGKKALPPPPNSG